MSVGQGGLKLDRGLSEYDRAHRLSLVYLWAVPGPRAGLWKHVLGGWSIAGITSFQTGAPFTLQNGSDRNNDAIPAGDRPDSANPPAPVNSRAVIAPATCSLRCVSGYRNPDSGACVTPADVHWIEGSGLPNGSTVGRNTLLAGGTNNFEASLLKSFPVGRAPSAGISLGGSERIQSSAVHSSSREDRSWFAAWAFSESRFHRQRYPQHVGAAQTHFLREGS